MERELSSERHGGGALVGAREVGPLSQVGENLVCHCKNYGFDSEECGLQHLCISFNGLFLFSLIIILLVLTLRSWPRICNLEP